MTEKPPHEEAEKALRFAAESLGPASEGLLRDPAALARVLARRRAGFRMKDAVLAEAHRAAGGDRRVADEFLAYFLRDMLRVGSGALSDGLRRYLDTGDLVQSVLGDLWSELASVTFETRARFIALLGQRLRWKAAQHARRMGSARRREDKRFEGALEELRLAREEPGPGTLFADREEADRVVLVLHRLPARDRELLTLRLKGLSNGEAGERVGLSADAARKAVGRAVERARELLG